MRLSLSLVDRVLHTQQWLAAFARAVLGQHICYRAVLTSVEPQAPKEEASAKDCLPAWLASHQNIALHFVAIGDESAEMHCRAGVEQQGALQLHSLAQAQLPAARHQGSGGKTSGPIGLPHYLLCDPATACMVQVLSLPQWAPDSSASKTSLVGKHAVKSATPLMFTCHTHV